MNLKNLTISDELRQQFKEMLEKNLPHLVIYINPEGDVSLWVKRYIDGRATDGEAITKFVGLNVREEWSDELARELIRADKAAKYIQEHKGEYFWCSVCNKVHPMSEFKANVFSGHYCKTCYDNDEGIRLLVKESERDGFYD